MRFSALQESLISSLMPVTLSLNIGSSQVILTLIPATIRIVTRFPFTHRSMQTRRVLQGGLAFQKAEPTTIGRAKNKRGGTMKRHVGSSFDEFLTDEGLLSEAEATAVKRVIAYQLSQFMEENKLSKTAMVKRMQTS